MKALSKITMFSLVAARQFAMATSAAAVTEIFASFIPSKFGSNIRYQKSGTNDGLVYTVANSTATTLGSTAVKFSFIGGSLESLGILNASFVFSGIATDNSALSLGGLLIQSLDSGFFGFAAGKASSPPARTRPGPARRLPGGDHHRNPTRRRPTA